MSRTKRIGQFAYREFYSAALHRPMVQWDYRAKTGKLHSGVAHTLEDAKKEAARKSGEDVCQKPV